MQEENESPRKNWDLMLGLALVLFGSFRLYQRLQSESELSFRILITAAFIAYGGFLIFRFVQNSKKD